LGAAWRLAECGAREWTLLETSQHAGGLASSFVDENGFTWDIGGHVQFSHYEYFDRVMDDLLGCDGWLHHQRESWVWMRDRFVPYPFQYNVHRLPADDLERCLAGLVDVAHTSAPPAKNFREWIFSTFGQGIADVFLLPYNFKVWAYPPEMLSTGWVGERVAVPDLKRVLSNLVHQRDDVSWGPNNTFRFPVRGGTGAIWRACRKRLPEGACHFGDAVTRIDLERRAITTKSDRTYKYDQLLSTVPLRELLRLADVHEFDELARRGLQYSSTHIVGIGLRGSPCESLRTKCWMYFPEDDCPFYRVTVFSNYSPNNVPDIRQHWSLMVEVSESAHKPVDVANLQEDVVRGLLATRLIEHREDIVSFWSYRAHYGYPTPVLDRDRALNEIIPFFEEHGVYSRGRFGLWKYEVSNQDHSFMQGVEWVERIKSGRTEITAFDPNHANSRKHPWPFEQWSGGVARA
jgi:protoporphyrinogen oxidase